jgi:uncharacterized protein
MEKFFKRPILIVAAIAAVTVFFAFQIPKAELNNDTAGFIPPNNAAYIASEHIDDTFGKQLSLFIGLERKYGDVFDKGFLTRIREFTDKVEDIEIVKDVVSILTTPYITADNESINITSLVDDDFSGTQEEIAELKRRLASWELYQGAIVSDNFMATQILVTLNISMPDLTVPKTERDIKTICDSAKEMLEDHAVVYLTGKPVMIETMADYMYGDLKILIPLVIVVLLVVLFFSFHRFTYIILPVLTVVICIIWTIGLMPIFNVQLTVASIIMPIILIAIGSADGIHIVSHYIYETRNKVLSNEEHCGLINSVLRKIIKPVILTTLTTVAGFASFCFAPLGPLRDFGLFSAIGVSIAWVITLLLIPSLLIMRGPHTEKVTDEKRVSVIDTTLGNGLTVLAGKKAIIIALAALIVVVSIYQLSNIVVDNSTVEYFYEDTEISRSDRFIRNFFGGTTQLNVAFEADTTDKLLSPEALSAIDSLSAYLAERVPHVGKVSGFTDMIKRMNQMFNVDEPPDGIRVRQQSPGNDDLLDFGEFGWFDDMEFEDILPPIEEKYPLQETQITFAMLDSAIGKHPNMNANELVRELQRQSNYEGRAYYEIPADPVRYGKQTEAELVQLITNYLVLVGGDNRTSYANDPLEPTAIKMTVMLNTQWQSDAQIVVSAINDYAAANFPGNIRVTIGGVGVLENELSNLVMHSQIISVIVSIIIVFIIIAISNSSFIAGLLAVLPLSIAVLCNFGLMGLLGVTLNMGTALIASLSVGIGIDYTIHFMEFFKIEYQQGGDYLRRTFIGCGKAIIINAVSVGAGFLVLALSHFRMLAEAGILIAFSMFITAVISLTLIPVLITVIKPRFIYGQNSASH